MLILALDTTSEDGGVGVFRDGECLAHVPNEGPTGHYSVSLFTLLERALQQARTRHGVPARGLADIELIAVASGPGSFTGIRVGLAAAKGWAKAFGLPVRGVPVLEALVEAASARTEGAASILDARRGEYFLGLFRRPAGGEVYVPEGEDWLLKPAKLASLLASRFPEGTVTCVVREHDRAALSLREVLPAACLWQVVSGTLLEAIARLGWRGHQAGEPPSASDLDALYIRRPDAEVNWKG